MIARATTEQRNVLPRERGALLPPCVLRKVSNVAMPQIIANETSRNLDASNVFSPIDIDIVVAKYGILYIHRDIVCSGWRQCYQAIDEVVIAKSVKLSRKMKISEALLRLSIFQFSNRINSCSYHVQ